MSRRLWPAWLGLSLLVAFGGAFLATGLFGGVTGAVVMFGAGLWYDAATPRILRAIGRRWG